ncbi:hypothetical protein [Methanobrevibacter sp.]|uniref:hypothetical protein n=1 Tax=Methanobrevibacter sp. TaxID=66852 RepID=UPI00388E50BD
MTNDVKIEVDEVNLEDLIILGEDKLINISIEYPEENDGVVKIVRTKAKIKQLTIKELRNIDLKNVNANTVASILSKALFKQDETNFSKELINGMPIGVCFAITREIMKISGVDENQLGF